MDLNEAEKSFDYFADLLKMQCSQLTLASDMAAKAASTEMAVQARENRNQALASLQESHKNSLIFSIVVRKEMGKQAARLVCVPLELAKVIAASNRLVQASQEAHLLIEAQREKHAQESKPAQPSETVKAISAFLEKHEREQAAELRRRRSLPDRDS
jgi:hypothetical protein